MAALTMSSGTDILTRTLPFMVLLSVPALRSTHDWRTSF